MYVETKGVVIRQTKYSESDKILTIFTKDRGKIQAIAKGARRPKSRLMGSTEVFCYSEFLMYNGKGLYNINQGEIIDSFYSLREDIYKLSYATFILELVDSSVLEEEANDILFELLIKTLKVLSTMNTLEDYKKLLLAFQIKYISFVGFRPQLINCVNCGFKIGDKVKFDILEGGVVCQRCFNINSGQIHLSLNIIHLMKILLYIKLEELEDITLSKAEEKKIEEVLIRYITSHIEKKNFKSLEFLKTL